MSESKNVDISPETGQLDVSESDIAVTSSGISSYAGSVRSTKTQQRVSSSSERQIKYERAQKCLENAALVSKRIKEHRKATAELLGRPFEDDEKADTASEMASTMSERTGYSAATDTSTTLSVQEALNIPGISESLANTLKQKELLMERIKQYKEISKRPIKTTATTKKESTTNIKKEIRKSVDNTDSGQLLNVVKEKENALTLMQVKMKAMETTILDLQEKLNEKDQIIEAKNMATTLMSDSLSKKEKDSSALLEDTKQQMTRMQENFATIESEWKEEKQRLLSDLQDKEDKVKRLQEANTILENSRFEISIAHSKLTEEIELKNKVIEDLIFKMEQLSAIQREAPSDKEKHDVDEEKGSLEISNMVEMTKKIELLEQLNCQIRQTNKELENKLASGNLDSKSPVGGSPIKKGSPLPSRKGGRNARQKSPWSNLSPETSQETDKKPSKAETSKLEMVIQSLNKEILDKEYAISQKDVLISELKSSNLDKEHKITELQTNMSQKEPAVDKADVGVLTEVTEDFFVKIEVKNDTQSPVTEEAESVSSIKELEENLKLAEDQISCLNQEIDAANVNMIKVKSNHKLKLKQMQKTIDNFSKVSDTNSELVKLNEEIHQLSQKVAELEEEKGNLQLHLVDYDSGRLTESDVYKKMLEMENLAETRLKSISILEAQKFDLVQELHVLQQKYAEMEDKLADMSQLQNEQVCSEMSSVQLEEQIDELIASKKELELVIDNLKLDKEQLNGTIKMMQEEKEEISHKLENYIQENMELTDKLEKLSAEKVSSAESIEIVESLTTQEKMELEEYNKGMVDNKIHENTENFNLPVPSVSADNLDNLMQQNIELNKKIDLFNLEREEVLSKMSKLNAENEALQQRILEVTSQCSSIEVNIGLLVNEKLELQGLNTELSRQIEELKRERLEVMKESVESIKPVEEVSETVTTEAPVDEKTTGDKGANRVKSVKQLTKEILKLKNTIKERENEIGDCQMKILSLEEQQQKNDELIHSISGYENKVRMLTEENNLLKETVDVLKRDKQSMDDVASMKQENQLLQQEILSIQTEYTATVNSRDAKIHELENLLIDYEKQILNFGNSLQQKDKEMSEYINQITKLNDVSQKLKSTIDRLEGEKARDQNAELVKSLNKQIMAYQKKLSECEEKLRLFEEEKIHLLTLKNTLESKNINLEKDLKTLQDTLAEKQAVIKELQVQQQRHAEELSSVKLEAKERDEEIHEIKLQLRKESIENEKLRTSLAEKENNTDGFTQELDAAREQLNKLISEKEAFVVQNEALEVKNKELIDKLKKFAITIKKKTTMYAELENQLHETQNELENKNSQIEHLSEQLNSLPAIEGRLKIAEEELNQQNALKSTIEQKNSSDLHVLQSEIDTLQSKLSVASQEISQLRESLNFMNHEAEALREEKSNLTSHVDMLNNKIVEHEIELKNNTNFTTKIATLEADIIQKQNYIHELLHKLEDQEQQLTQLQFGHDAKLQERDLFIESLETEINKYKNRIGRLEESISVMEDRRNSLERKADELDSQLHEKQKAYSDFSNQEDELINRFAALIDHDKVVEKQMKEVERDNQDLQNKLHYINDENQRLRKSLADFQEHCNTLTEKASRADSAESELIKYQTKARELEAYVKRVTHDQQTLLEQKKRDILELESEFNTQIESAISEKRSLSEKYEKINEHVSSLESKIQEYNSNIQNLQINLEEATRINHELMMKASQPASVPTPDYTEQYITEINKLNSVVNGKNQEIIELHNAIQNLETNNMSIVANLEHRIYESNANLHKSSTEIDDLIKELNYLKQINEELQTTVTQKDTQIKQLMERKMTFEMNIPKTEGMVISSTIEPMSEVPPGFDISALESQIVDPNEPQIVVAKVSESTQKEAGGIKQNIEEAIVSKKAYDCYKDDDPTEGADPFNSDEGWGLGECEEVGEVTPGFSHLNEQILKLKNDNEVLKTNLEASNNKLIRALKKLKELKSSNEMLSNELKITKQISQSSSLDNAIEGELTNHIQELEKKIEELNAELIKEKRERESLRKQNDVFHNANDKLTEMKERLDSEVELWKFKFKEVNDKMSSLQWENKDTPEHKPKHIEVSEESINEELLKLEKENDELQSMVDQLTAQNRDLSKQATQLRNEIISLTQQSQHSTSAEDLECLHNRISELQHSNDDLNKNNTSLNIQLKELIENKDTLSNKLQELEITYNELIEKFENTKTENEEKVNVLEENRKLLENRTQLMEEVDRLKRLELECNTRIIDLEGKLEDVRCKLVWHEENAAAHNSQNVDNFALVEKYSAMEEHCATLTSNIDSCNERISQLQSDKQLLNEKVKTYEDEIGELNKKIEQLNSENDQLLSSVTELRSSVSSAVDQRGFEIAELWKQHLAQRESDFQKLELELRTQIAAYEAKYEQLLDNVQSSSQEETNKIIYMEQVNSLQSKLQDKEQHLKDLQDKYSEVMNEISILQSETQDEKVTYENKLLAQQEEYEKLMREMNNKSQEVSEGFQQTFRNVQDELSETKSRYDMLQQQIEESNLRIKDSQEKVMELTNQLLIKDSEIYQKTHDYSLTLAQRNEEFENVRKKMLEYEKRIDDLTYEKESELAVLRLKMHENKEYYENTIDEMNADKQSLLEDLNAKIVECTALNKQITDLNQLLAEHSSRTVEMQTALENQELEIVNLKDEIKAIEDMMRASTTKIERHVTFAADTKPGAEGELETGLNRELLDAVPRAELDLALYMLHQRDVRCEELTMELTQLLEERDTLQLRLSDSLRSYEDIRSKCVSAGVDTSLDSSQEAAELHRSSTEREFVDVHKAHMSRSSSISDPDNDKPKLQAKLSELRSVSHSRDVLLRHDSEQRDLSMRLLQRDVANLPPEAMEQLAQAHHTLSRDAQSTSTVLLNWLRGKSTPKVVHM